MGISGRRTSGKSGPSARDAAGIEVETAVARESRVSKHARHPLGLNFARQGLLRRGVALSMDIGPGRSDAAKGGLSSRKAAPIIKVEGVEIRPEKTAQIATRRKAGHTSRRGVLSSRPSPKPSSRDATRSQAPIIIRKGAPNQVTKGRPNIAISIAETPHMDIGRNSTERIEDLGPPGARAEQTESALSVRELADSCQEDPGLADAPTKQILTPT